MKKLRALVDTPAAMRIFSAGFMVYVGLSTLGRTGSYWDALNGMVLFAAIWLLGKNSASPPERQP